MLEVEGEEILRDGLSFVVVGLEEAGVSEVVQAERKFPGEVEGIVHGYVHSLRGFGGVCVRCLGDGQMYISRLRSE